MTKKIINQKIIPLVIICFRFLGKFLSFTKAKMILVQVVMKGPRYDKILFVDLVTKLKDNFSLYVNRYIHLNMFILFQTTGNSGTKLGCCVIEVTRDE